MKPTQLENKLDDGIWNADELQELEEKANKANQWGAMGTRTYKALSVTHKKLPAGCYSVTIDNRDGSAIFVGKFIKTDNILRFKGDLADKMLKEIDEFWKQEDKFKQHGFLHKRGYLLYGGAGCGKSSIIWQVAKDIIDRDGLVLVCGNPQYFTEALKTVRLVEKDRPIVCIFEDIDAIITKYGDSELLSILDGDNMINRVINVASTNYPEKLDKRIVSRPRRFDRLYKIEAPEKAIIEEYLTKKLPKGYKVKEWVKKTTGLSFAGITETLISVLCLGNELDETVKILKDLESKTPSSSDFKSVGFDNEDNDDSPTTPTTPKNN